MATEAAVEPVKPTPKPEALNYDSILLEGVKIVPEGEKPKPEEQKPPTEEKPPEQKPEETAADKENPFEQFRPAGTREPKSEKAQENFKTVVESRNAERKAREEAEAKAKELEEKYTKREQEFTELQAKFAKIEDPTGSDIARYQAELQKRDQSLQQLQVELRAASIERDPEFVEKFTKGKESRVTRLQEFAVMTGVEPAEFQRAMKYGDEDKLSEIKDSLTPGQRYQWDAMRSQIAALDYEREDAIQNSHKTWEQLQKTREEQFNQQRQQSLQQNFATARKIQEDFRSQIPLLNDNPELAKQVEANLTALAGGEGRDHFTPEQIMRSVALLPVLLHRDRERDKIVEGYAEIEKENAELKKKLQERDEFIQKRHGGDGDGSGIKKTVGEGEIDPTKSLWDQIKVRS